MSDDWVTDKGAGAWWCRLCKKGGREYHGPRHCAGARHKKRLLQLPTNSNPTGGAAAAAASRPQPQPPPQPQPQPQPSIPLPPVPASPPVAVGPQPTSSAGAAGPSPATAEAAAVLHRLQRPLPTPPRIAPPSFDSSAPAAASAGGAAAGAGSGQRRQEPSPAAAPAATSSSSSQHAIVAGGVGSLGILTFAKASAPAPSASASGAVPSPVGTAALVPTAQGFQTPPAPPSTISPLILAPPVIPVLPVTSVAVRITFPHPSFPPSSCVDQRCAGEGDVKCDCSITRSEDGQFYIVDIADGLKAKRCFGCQHSVGLHPLGM